MPERSYQFSQAQKDASAEAIKNFYAPIQARVSEIQTADKNWQPHENFRILIDPTYIYDDQDRSTLRSFPSMDSQFYKDLSQTIASMPVEQVKEILSLNYKNPFNLTKLKSIIPQQYGLSDLVKFKGNYTLEHGGEIPKKFTRGGLFDKQKLAKRVIGRAWDINGNEATVGPISAWRQYLFNNDDAVKQQIDSAKEQLAAYERGELNLDQDQITNLQSFLAHQDGLNTYLGLSQWNNSFRPAEYKPTKGTLENGRYLTYMRTPGEKEYMMDKLSEGRLSGELARTGRVQAVNPYLRNFQLSYGVDPVNGPYAAAWKPWDYNISSPAMGENYSKIQLGDNLHQWVGGKPFDVYDRINFADYYGIPKEKLAPKEGDYYGEFLPEITVLGNQPRNRRLQGLHQARNLTPKKQVSESLVSDDMWKNMSGDEIIDNLTQQGFLKNGGPINYSKLWMRNYKN